MKFIVKYFQEITIKSKPVRKQLTRQLRENLKAVLLPLDPEIDLDRGWDQLVITPSRHDDELHRQIVERLRCTSGIAYFTDVLEFPLEEMEQVYQRTQAIWGERVVGKRFVVRCKRTGRDHDFTSTEVERYVGGGLAQHNATAGVDLHTPEVTVRLEIREQTLYVINQRYEGLGGFPIASLDPVISLISGGFDSCVSTFEAMRRGMRTHFLFFNLGGQEHEIGVREVALYLWHKFGGGQRVKFISVPFDGVVAELLNQVPQPYMGVVLKRMMLRAGERMMERLHAEALVTGESVAQVSSQTLINLKVIDQVTDALVLRPLITRDKEDIVAIAEQIGTFGFAAAMPEYCGIISVKPKTRAKLERVLQAETHFDLGILEQAVERAALINIDDLAEQTLERQEVEVLSVPLHGAIVLDIRNPHEAERSPLRIPGVQVRCIPFYQLHGETMEWQPQTTYMLYCDQGVMSRLHAAQLVAKGMSNIKVYRPDAR